MPNVVIQTHSEDTGIVDLTFDKVPYDEFLGELFGRVLNPRMPQSALVFVDGYYAGRFNVYRDETGCPHAKWRPHR